jgi:hypothetical protein
MNKNKIRYAGIVLALCLLSSLLTYMAVRAASPTITFTLTAGLYPGSPGFTVFYDGTNYFAKNSSGVIAYSDSLLSDVMNLTIDNLKTNGGSIFLSRGSYTIDNYINLSSKITIKGEGIGQTILTASTTMGFYGLGTAIAPLHTITIKDLTLIGANISGKNGIDFAYVYSNVRLENLEIKFFDDNVKLDNCYAISVRDCEFNYAVTIGLDCYICNGLLVDDNKFYGNPNGVMIQDCTGIHICNNDFEESTSNGLVITYFGIYRTQKAQVYANYFEGNTKDIADRGIATTIRDSYFINTHSTTRALTIENVSSTVTGNYFYNYTSQPIWIVSGAANITVVFNAWKGTTALYVDDGTTSYFQNNTKVP